MSDDERKVFDARLINFNLFVSLMAIDALSVPPKAEEEILQWSQRQFPPVDNEADILEELQCDVKIHQTLLP